MAGLVNTSFGEIGKRDLFVLRIYLENFAETINDYARKAKLLMENWNELDIFELESLLWDICILFKEDCAICPMFFCPKSKLKAGKRDDRHDE